MLTRKTLFNISRTKNIEDVDLLRHAVSSCEDVPTTDNGTTTRVAFPTTIIELIPQQICHPRKFPFYVHLFTANDLAVMPTRSAFCLFDCFSFVSNKELHALTFT